MDKRATTSKMKRAVIERLLAAWELAPEQRLGQLIDNGCCNRAPREVDLFQVEDFDLVADVEHFVADAAKRQPCG